MKRLILLSVLILGAGCGPAPNTVSQSNPPDKQAELTKVEGLSRYALATPISYGNVSIVPIVDVSTDKPQDPDQTDYVSLTEAKKNGWIEIHEIPGNSEVSSLEVENTGSKPILLLAGELLLGGQQDRIVAKDTVVPPGKTMKVPVFCVEPGRWEGTDKRFGSGGGMVPQSVRKEAVYGDQTKVWDKVGAYNEGVVTTFGTGRISGTSVRGGLSAKEVQSRIEGDLPKFQKDLNSVKNVVGFVYVLNGEVQTAELFGNPRMFDAGRDGLLKGFLADAAVVKPDEKAKVSMPDCVSFFKDVMAGKRNQTALRAGNADVSVAGGMTMGVESTKVDTKAGEHDGGGFLHGSYSKKD